MNRRQLIIISLASLSACKRGKREEAERTAPPAATQPPAPSLVPSPEASTEKELAYALELKEESGTRRVKESYRFASGDQFRVVFRPGFRAYVYLVNRGAGQASYSMLFPHPKIAVENPIPSGKALSVPDVESGWMRFDDREGDENFILIASTVPLEEMMGLGKTVPRDDFEARLAKVERKFRPSSSRRFEDSEWVKLFAARQNQEDLALILRLPLQHG